MKYLYHNLILILILCSFASKIIAQSPPVKADSAITQSLDDDKIMVVEDCDGIANSFIDKDTAQDRIEHFRKVYRSGQAKNSGMELFEDSVWVDAEIIIAFANYLKRKSDRDGMQIISIKNNHNDSSSICLVPTVPKGNAKHKIKWGDRINITGENYQFRNFNLKKCYGKSLRRKFNKNYRKKRFLRKPIVDSLSESVWMQSCAFTYLSSLLANPNNNLDGIRVYFAAYFKKEKLGNFQKYDNQSTVLLVPTSRNERGEHITDWNIIQEKYKIPVKSIESPKKALNHGQLCPNNCKN